MKIAARRRLAVGVLATTSAVIAGVLIAPVSNAAPNGVTVSPSAVFNSGTQTLTFTTTEADLRLGGSADLTRIGGPATSVISFDVNPTVPPSQRNGSASVNFSDGGTGLGQDGPADAGNYAVSIDGDVAGNDTCPSCFTILPTNPLALSSLSPNSLRPTQTANVSLLGAGFTRSTSIEFLLGTTPDPLVTANAQPTGGSAAQNTEGITTDGELRRSLTVKEGAAAGLRNVRVTNPDGTTATCTGCFTVSGAPLTSIMPSGGNNTPTSSLTTLTVEGMDITTGQLTLEFTGNPGSASRQDLTIPTTKVSQTTTSFTATVNLSNAAPGTYQPIVRGAGGIANACTCRFTVLQENSRIPTLTSLDRSSDAGVQKNLAQGETATFTATGTNFSRGATLVFSPAAGLTVTAVQFISPTQLTATIAAADNTAPGDKSVQARLTDGKTSTACTACLTVTAVAASPSPSASASPSTSASPSPSASASPSSFTFNRFSGGNRFETAANIATGTFTTSSFALLASGEADNPNTPNVNEAKFADALAGAYLAGFRQAPLLLTTAAVLPAPTRSALEKLAVRNVVILGGTSVVSTAVENDLRADGYTVTRIAGADRFETARRIALSPGAANVGTTPGGLRTAVVATGADFADALVTGPLGYAADLPILLTTQASLGESARLALGELDIDKVLIPGGLSAVSANVEAQIRALGIETQRFDGRTRTDTAVKVADYAYDTLGFDRSHIGLAFGGGFADALAGGPSAGVKRAPIVLTVTVDNIGTDTDRFLRARGSALRTGDIYGGTAAVSNTAQTQAQTAIRSSSTASPSPSGSASPSVSATPSGSASPSPSASPTGGGLPFP